MRESTCSKSAFSTDKFSSVYQTVDLNVSDCEGDKINCFALSDGLFFRGLRAHLQNQKHSGTCNQALKNNKLKIRESQIRKSRFYFSYRGKTRPVKLFYII